MPVVYHTEKGCKWMMSIESVNTANVKRNPSPSYLDGSGATGSVSLDFATGGGDERTYDFRGSARSRIAVCRDFIIRGCGRGRCAAGRDFKFRGWFGL